MVTSQLASAPSEPTTFRLSELLGRVAPGEALLRTASREVAHALMDIRGEHGLTQAALAQSVGVSQAYISQLESGAANPSVRSLAALLMAAGYRLRLTIEALPDGPIRMPDGQAKSASNP